MKPCCACRGVRDHIHISSRIFFLRLRWDHRRSMPIKRMLLVSNRCEFLSLRMRTSLPTLAQHARTYSSAQNVPWCFFKSGDQPSCKPNDPRNDCGKSVPHKRIFAWLLYNFRKSLETIFGSLCFLFLCPRHITKNKEAIVKLWAFIAGRRAAGNAQTFPLPQNIHIHQVSPLVPNSKHTGNLVFIARLQDHELCFPILDVHDTRIGEPN